MVVLDGNAHAQHIFKTRQRDELTKHILDWLTSSPSKWNLTP